MNRADSILLGIDRINSTILEFGPLYRPLVPKTRSGIYFADHCTTSELVEKYKNDPVVSQYDIPAVDFVIGESGLLSACGSAAPYDVIIASHVIEHVPDIIGWLKDVNSLLKTGARLCLAVPDKRFTFDILRRLTTVKDITEAHEARYSRPPLDIVCDSYRNSVGFPAGAVWNAPLDLKSCAVGWPASVISEKIAAYNRGEYVDVHCNVFTPWQFISIMKFIVTTHKIDFSLKYFRTTQTNDEEFHVQLEKSDEETDWDELITTYTRHANWPSYDYGRRRLYE